MHYKILADSSANRYVMSEIDFANVPLRIITAKAEYVDTTELNVATMVDEIKATKGKSGTSCPNVADWLEAFQGGDRIFAVTITSNLSGSYAAAVQAAEDYEAENPGAKVCVLDSLSAGPELGLILDRLQQLIQSGMEYEEIVTAIRGYMSHTHLTFSLESLTNLARNGRVNPAVAKIAGVLGIRVVGVASEVGTLEALHKCRGEKKALEAIFSEMEKRGFTGGNVIIAHCFNEIAANQLTQMIRGKYPESPVEIEPCGALCSFYAERGGLLVGFEDGKA